MFEHARTRSLTRCRRRNDAHAQHARMDVMCFPDAEDTARKHRYAMGMTGVFR